MHRIHLILVCGVLAVFSACSDDGGGDNVIIPPPGDANWHWMNPVSAGATLSDVWGPAADNLLATGNGGIVLRYDGSGWRRTQTPATENLNGIWGADATHVFAVGQDGVILSYNGTSWARENSPTTQNLNDVWGTSATDVYAVGASREVLHFDGASWDTMTVAPGIEILRSLWGSSAHDIYATGLGTKLLHYDGVAWGEVETNANFALNAVWGLDSTDVFVVGGNGAAAHYDGVAWSDIDVGEPLFPNVVWGTATDDVYAMGIASGGASFGYRWDGFSWSPLDMRSFEGIRGLFGVDGEIVAVGQSGLIHEKVGADFLPMDGGLTADLESVWVTSDGTEAFAVGDFGVILHFENGAWSPMMSGTTTNLRGVAGRSASDVIAVGENGVVLRFNGAGWNDASPGIPVHYNEAWMDAPGSAFVVGEGATVVRLENGGWTPLSLGSLTQTLRSVWGSSATNVYIVGDQSTAFRWMGDHFKIVVVEPTNFFNYHSVTGTGPDDVFIGAELVSAPPPSPLHAGGNIFHWDGGPPWTSIYSDPISDVVSIWRANTSEGLATGNPYSVLVESSGGNEWVRILDIANLPYFVNCVAGSSMRNAFVVGDDGAIVRFSP